VSTRRSAAVEPSTAGVDESIDIVYVSYQRPVFTRLSLDRLLSTCDQSMRVWLWHNGDQEETLRLVRTYRRHPRVHRFHHERVNTGLKGLAKPINWILEEGTARYVSKVDDDCLVRPDWAKVLRSAHADIERLGAVGCWRFRPEDFQPRLAEPKIEAFRGGHWLLRNCWIEGTGFLMKRECYEDVGPIPRGMGFTTYCVHLAAAGWLNGWYYPFVHQEHMDDPRSPYWTPPELQTFDPALTRFRTVAAGTTEVKRVRNIRRRAARINEASIDPMAHLALNMRLRKRLRASFAT